MCTHAVIHARVSLVEHVKERKKDSERKRVLERGRGRERERERARESVCAFVCTRKEAGHRAGQSSKMCDIDGHLLTENHATLALIYKHKRPDLTRQRRWKIVTYVYEVPLSTESVEGETETREGINA